MDLLQDIFDDCQLNVQRYERVHGGDINDAYCLSTQSEKYFLKINNKTRYPSMFEKEANGLELLRKNSTLVIPRVIKTGNFNEKQYLLLQWLDKGSPKKDMWQKFGEALAVMHKQTQDCFGSVEHNYIGSLEQINDQHMHWHSFYAECRIMPLVRRLKDQGLCSSKDVKAAEVLCSKFEELFPEEPAAFLHGDLWAGNYFIHASGYTATFDPAVYFGHREMDIGMTKLFSGFDQRFYEAYNHDYPLQTGWQKRLPLTQLYPLLVHAVLFQGHYIASAFDSIDQFA